MEFKLKEHQKEALQFLIDKHHCGLFIDMGLGKTTICLYYLIMQKLITGNIKALVIAPKAVCRLTWAQELNKWGWQDELSIGIFSLDNMPQTDIVLVSPEQVRNVVIYMLKNFGKQHDYFDILIVDESSKFKSWMAKRSILLRTQLDNFKKRIILTGTPMPKDVQDVFSQIYLLDKGQTLGSKITHFRELYCKPHPFIKHKFIANTEASDIITKKIAPLIMVKKKEECLDLEDISFIDIPISINSRLKKLYFSAMEDFVLNTSQGDELINNGGVLYMKLRQLATGHLYINDGTAFDYISRHKADALAEFLEINEGKPILLAYNFKFEKETLAENFPKAKFLDSKNPESAKIVEDWNNGKIPLLCCNPKSVAHGINLQHGGSQIIWYSPTDNLEDYLQFNARLHRTGQTQKVQVFHFVSNNTIEQLLYSRIKRKHDNQEEMLLKLIREFCINKGSL